MRNMFLQILGEFSEDSWFYFIAIVIGTMISFFIKNKEEIKGVFNLNYRKKMNSLIESLNTNTYRDTKMDILKKEEIASLDFINTVGYQWPKKNETNF